MRELLVHRPLMLLATGLVLGVAAVNHWFAIALLIALLAFLRALKPGIACALGFCLGAALAPGTHAAMFPKQWIDVEARVVSVPKLYSDEISATIETRNGIRLQMGGAPTLHFGIGDTVHVKGDAKPLAVGSERLADRGISGRLWADQLKVIAPAPFILRIGQAWRNSFISFVDATLPVRAANATEAVCFNVQSRLDDQDREAFSRAGTVHAISASGLHVGLIALVLFGLLSLIPIPRGVQLGVVAAVLVLYAIASGLHPPVVRAAILFCVLSAAYLARRDPDLLSALGLAAVVQLLWDPTAIYDVGFQFTFVVLLAVGVFPVYAVRRPPARFRRALHVWDRIRRPLLVVVAAAPIAAYQFGAVSITSIFANLSLIVALPVLIVGALVSHLASFLSLGAAAGLMTWIVGPLSGWLLFVTDHLGGEWAVLNVPEFSGYWLFVIYSAFLLVWRPRLRPA